MIGILQHSEVNLRNAAKQVGRRYNPQVTGTAADQLWIVGQDAHQQLRANGRSQ